MMRHPCRHGEHGDDKAQRKARAEFGREPAAAQCADKSRELTEAAQAAVGTRQQLGRDSGLAQRAVVHLEDRRTTVADELVDDEQGRTGQRRALGERNGSRAGATLCAIQADRASSNAALPKPVSAAAAASPHIASKPP